MLDEHQTVKHGFDATSLGIVGPVDLADRFGDGGLRESVNDPYAYDVCSSMSAATLPSRPHLAGSLSGQRGSV